jgi:hypothetical protein
VPPGTTRAATQAFDASDRDQDLRDSTTVVLTDVVA